MFGFFDNNNTLSKTRWIFRFFKKRISRIFILAALTKHYYFKSKTDKFRSV